jgi:hypothetical protein
MFFLNSYRYEKAAFKKAISQISFKTDLMKNVLLILLSFSLLICCKNANQNTRSKASDTQANLVNLSVDGFLENPASFVDQQVTLSGLVAHVCKHGGQKLFMIGTDPDKYLRINTGENIPEFPIDLEGSTIEVKGVVSKFEEEVPEPVSTDEAAASQSDTSSLEKAYHKDNFYVVVADSYVTKE